MEYGANGTEYSLKTFKYNVSITFLQFIMTFLHKNEISANSKFSYSQL
jgi:hypothetical protein